jgi:hypothetical protein
MKDQLMTLIDLPKDVIWIIIKHYLNDVLCRLGCKRNSLHISTYFQKRCIWVRRCEFEKTITNDNIKLDWTEASVIYFIDYLYSLRLISKKFDFLMREKITRGASGRLKVSI